MKEKIKKTWYKKWWVITIFVIIGLAILGNLFGGNEATSISLNTETKQQIVAKTEEAKTYSIGDSILAGDFNWKITKSSTATEIGEDVYSTFFGEKADGIFIILDVEVENTGNSAEYLMDSYLKLVDEQGREFSPNSMAAIYLKPQGSALMFQHINPGITKKGKIVFDVPVGLKIANVRISSNSLSSTFYNVKLLI